MSFQRTQDIAARLVKAEEELKRLKTSQIIGGENMGYFEYIVPNLSHTVAPRLQEGQMAWALLVFDCSTPFPLVSMELDVYENGVYKPNPYMMNGTAYGATRDSACIYTFLAQENAAASYWEREIVYNIAGKQISSSEPRNYFYQVSFTNRTDASVTVELRNIKIRTSHSGVVYGEMRTGDWWD